jgi:hypothetical protein
MQNSFQTIFFFCKGKKCKLLTFTQISNVKPHLHLQFLKKSKTMATSLSKIQLFHFSILHTNQRPLKNKCKGFALQHKDPRKTITS